MNKELMILDDPTLLRRTEAAAKNEREAITVVLQHLAEVERRKLFASHGYSSLFDYCVRGLRYSEPAAQRRITAMRLLRKLPEVEEKIQSGSLTLSHLAQAQAHFRQEARANHALRRREKINVIREIEGASSREAEKKLFAMASVPQPRNPDKSVDLATPSN